MNKGKFLAAFIFSMLFFCLIGSVSAVDNTQTTRTSLLQSIINLLMTSGKAEIISTITGSGLPPAACGSTTDALSKEALSALPNSSLCSKGTLSIVGTVEGPFNSVFGPVDGPWTWSCTAGDYVANCSATKKILAGCTQEYSPVCATNGKTYSNKCEATLAQVTIDHTGECSNGIILTFPTPNSNLVKGSTYNITWTGSDVGVDSYSVYLLAPQTGTAVPTPKFLGIAYSSLKLFTWTVPTDIVAGNGYNISLSGYGASGNIVTKDSSFTISDSGSTCVLENHSISVTPIGFTQVCCPGLNLCPAANGIVGTRGTCKKSCDTTLYQKIASVEGNKSSYTPGEKINLTIRGTTTDGIANKEDGWNIQYYTYNVNDPSAYLQENISLGNYNASYSNGYWYANYVAPQQIGSYYTEITLYCSQENSKCWNLLGRNSAEYKTKIYYTVTGSSACVKEGSTIAVTPTGLSQSCCSGLTLCPAANGILGIRGTCRESCGLISDSLINVLTPNGGEQWVWGTTHDITWKSSEVDKVNISLVFENGGGISIASDVPASLGKYSWKVDSRATYSDKHKISISDSTDGSIVDTSDNYFSIISVASDWKTYTDNKYGFKINYPKDWGVNTNELRGAPDLVFCPAENKNADGTCMTTDSGLHMSDYKTPVIYLFAYTGKPETNSAANSYPYLGFKGGRYYYLGNADALSSIAKQMVASFKFIDSINCTQEYNPVCGSDGKTYSNTCMAKIAGITNVTPGACKATITLPAPDKPLNQMTRDELMSFLIKLIQALLGSMPVEHTTSTGTAQ